MQRSRQIGFTLIELVVTMVVAVVLALLAAPSFRDLIIKSRLRGATDDIVNLLNTARANSVKLDRPVNVSVQGTTAWCAGAKTEAGPSSVGAQLSLTNTPCNCAGTTVDCLVETQNALVSSTNYTGVTMSSNSGGIAYASSSSGGVTFDPKFGALTPLSTTSPQVVLASGRYSTQITVSPLGQTNACSVGGKFISGYPSC